LLREFGGGAADRAAELGRLILERDKLLRDQAAAGAGLGGPLPADPIQKLKQAQAGLFEVANQMRTAVAGTFNAVRLANLGGRSPEEQLINNTAKTNALIREVIKNQKLFMPRFS
jgi:hypothetical protein